MTVREIASRARDPFFTALVTMLAQGLLYAVTVRDDVRDMKHELRGVKCEIAVEFKRPTLPEGCNPNRSAGR